MAQGEGISDIGEFLPLFETFPSGLQRLAQIPNAA